MICGRQIHAVFTMDTLCTSVFFRPYRPPSTRKENTRASVSRYTMTNCRQKSRIIKPCSFYYSWAYPARTCTRQNAPASWASLWMIQARWKRTKNILRLSWKASKLRLILLTWLILLNAQKDSSLNLTVTEELSMISMEIPTTGSLCCQRV